jgi:nitrogenase subunit NifH
MSITCNENAPLRIPKEVIDALPLDLEIVKLERRHKELKHMIQHRYKYISRAPDIDIVKEYKQLGPEIRNKKKERNDDLSKKYREEFFYQSHNKEMQRQLNRIELRNTSRLSFSISYQNGRSYKKSYAISEQT